MDCNTACVLFVVTIPTAAEEERLKSEFLAKQYDLIKSERGESTPVNAATNFPLKVVSNKTTATAASLYTTPTTIRESKFHKNEDGTINDNSDIISSTTVDDTSTIVDDEATEGITSELSSIHATYSIYPKRRKLTQKPKTMEELSNIIRKEEDDVDTNLAESRESLKDFLPSSKRKIFKKQDESIELELEEDNCMEAVLKEILKKFQVQGAIWTKNVEGVMYQILFTVEFNEIYEKILFNFNEWGIGDREGSTVSVMNCITSKIYANQKVNSENDFCTQNNIAQKQSAWERFMNSVRSRLNVANIMRDVRQDASITFDFVVLLVSAAILASFGLVENSTIFLASSMLISPLMGPIIAAIFGTVIKEHSLQRLGLKNEILGILMAVFVGFLFGMVVCTIDERYSIGDGLTEEMLARCEFHSLIVGVFTAIPSGAAAAIGILGGNIGSLVGVAISASLLPPAVNSGLLWALALIYKFFEKDESRYKSVVKTTQYSKNQANELAILGSISMCLTISNIICIYIMGIIVLKVKEIAPVISRNSRYFWKHDIKIARDLNRNGFDTDTAIIDELTNLPKKDQEALGISCEFLRSIQKNEDLYQSTWSPLGGRYSFENTYEQIKENFSTIHRLDKLYSTLTKQHSLKEKIYKLRDHRHTGHFSDFGTSYKVLSENIRCSTLPTKITYPAINLFMADKIIPENLTASGSRNTTTTSTPTGTVDERKLRKFIVTPANEDPLHSALIHSKDGDILDF